MTFTRRGRPTGCVNGKRLFKCIVLHVYHSLYFLMVALQMEILRNPIDYQWEMLGGGVSVYAMQTEVHVVLGQSITKVF